MQEMFKYTQEDCLYGVIGELKVLVIWWGKFIIAY